MSTKNQQNTQDSIDQAKRRRIIKGLAAIPAMTTLASGAAMAATSSQCLDNLPRPPEGTFNYPTSGDATVNCVAENDPDFAALPSDPTVYYDQTDQEAPIRSLYNVDGADRLCIQYVDPNTGAAAAAGPNAGSDITTTASCYTSFTV